MISRLTVLVQGATREQRSGRTPAPADRAETAMLRRAAAFGDRLGRIDHAWCGPFRAAADTAEAIGLDPRRESALRDLDLGSWTGRELSDIAVADPDGLSQWLGNGCADAHGGESFDGLLRRIGEWMERIGPMPGHHLAIAPAMVARAAIVFCMGGNASMVRRVDLDPLCAVRFDGRERRWTLRAIVPASAGSERNKKAGSG